MRKILIAFDLTQQAIRAETLFEYFDIDLDTRPTPKEITAGCALSIDIPLEDFPLVQEIIKKERVEIRGFYYEKDGHYFEFKGDI